MAERLNRSLLVERAAALSDDIGLDAVTITTVAKAVGIAAPGVYRHVDDISDLRGAIAELASVELSVELARASAGLADRDALGAVARTMRSWAKEHPGRYAALQIAPEPDDTVGLARAHAMLEAFGSVLRGYEIAGDDFTDAVRLVRSAVHGFIGLEINEGFKQERSLDATFERIVDALHAVLRAWESPREPAGDDG